MDNEKKDVITESEQLQQENFPVSSIEAEEKAIEAVHEIEKDLEKISDAEVKKCNINLNKDSVPDEELEEMTDEELIKKSDDDIKKLYDSLSSFLVETIDIEEDVGVKQVVPTGIEILDTILGGGFAIGSMGILVGNPGSGKSMLAMQTLGATQRKFKTKVIASYLDAEQSTTTERLCNLGVRFPKIKPFTNINIEKVFAFLEGQCIFKEKNHLVDIPSLIVWDSIANTLSEKEMQINDINSTIGLKAKILSRLLPKYIQKCAKYNICLLAINQLRDLISMDRYRPANNGLKFMQSGQDMPGGRSLKFNAFHLLQLKIRGVTDPEKHGFDGILVSCSAVKNKLFPPNIEIILIGDFSRGFSRFWTNFNFLVTQKRIKAASWYTLPGFDKKFRVKESLTLYNTDKQFRDAYEKLLRETLDDFIRDKKSV